MIRFLRRSFITVRRLSALWRLALTLKRFGAIDALGHLPFMPKPLLWALKASSFFVPTRLDADRMKALGANSLNNNSPNNNNLGARLARAFTAMGPAYIKLGQTLATRPDLIGDIFAADLAHLQDRLPAFDFALARALIEKDLGAIEAIFQTFETKPVAAASIAQVHRAQLKDGTPVAVKILRPQIKARFMADIALFDWLATLGERYSAEGRRLRLKQIVEKLRETSNREMDLRLEAAASTELKENMAGEPDYYIPKIYWSHTSAHILTSEWIDGIRLSDRQALIKAGHECKYLAGRLVDIFLKQALRDGYFHADLHPGNLLVTPNGQLVALDFGIMGRLSEKERHFLAETLYGFIHRQYRRVAEVHFEAGYVPKHHNIDDFAQALRSINDPILDLPLDKVSAGKLLAQLFATTARFDMQTQPQLLLLQRSMMMAEGLALQLDPTVNMGHLSKETLTHWMRLHLSPVQRLQDGTKKWLKALDFLGELPDFCARIEQNITEKTAQNKALYAKMLQQNKRWAFGAGVLAAGFMGLSLYLGLNLLGYI